MYWYALQAGQVDLPGLQTGAGPGAGVRPDDMPAVGVWMLGLLEWEPYLAAPTLDPTTQHRMTTFSLVFELVWFCPWVCQRFDCRSARAKQLYDS